MSGRLFDPSSDQPLQPRAIIPQMDTRAAGSGVVGSTSASTRQASKQRS